MTAEMETDLSGQGVGRGSRVTGSWKCRERVNKAETAIVHPCVQHCKPMRYLGEEAMFGACRG